MSAPFPTFDVLSQDMHGRPVECSYCDRPIKKVVALPLPSLAASNNNDSDRWIGVCAYCVLAMAKALQAAEGAGQ